MTLGSNSCLIVLAAIILSVPKIGANGSTIGNVIKEERDFSVFHEKIDDGLSKYTPWLENGGTVDCLANSKTCISLCYDLRKARQDGNCDDEDSKVPRRLTFIDDNHDEKNISEENRHPFQNDPCAAGWMASSIKKNFKIFENGSIYVLDFDEKSVSSLVEYCLLWDKELHQYSAKVCRPWVRQSPYEIWCLTFAILIMILIFIVFNIVPELKNFHGLTIRCYVATNIALYVAAFGVECTTESRSNERFFTFWDIGGRYFGASCAFWLNVMSFNIWRSFRRLRPAIGNNFKKRKRQEFIWYAVYAWGGPVVLFSVAAAVTKHVPYFRTGTRNEAVKRWGSVALITVALLCNIVLHTLTALNIRKQKKDVAHLANGVDKHYAADKQWFNMYLKLFAIMGAHMVLWLVWLIWPWFVHILGTFEVLQSILIFVIFVWKDNVIRSLRIRLRRSKAISICKMRIRQVQANTPSQVAFTEDIELNSGIVLTKYYRTGVQDR